MIRRSFLRIALTLAGTGVYSPGAACATLYPIAPPNTFVALDPADFIQAVPEHSPGLFFAPAIIGDNIGQHPGGFGGGANPGDYFIGVFGGNIDTTNPRAAVYLWETSGGQNTVPFPGPLIQLGYWNGTFTPYGTEQPSSYLGTGALENGPFPFREITSSITPLSAFGITPGFPFPLNAVRIDANPQGQNQVTAVATLVNVPEPSTVLLLGGGFVVVLGCRTRGRRGRPYPAPRYDGYRCATFAAASPRSRVSYNG
jgi:PEP-CTERM motif